MSGMSVIRLVDVDVNLDQLVLLMLICLMGEDGRD